MDPPQLLLHVAAQGRTANATADHCAQSSWRKVAFGLQFGPRRNEEVEGEEVPGGLQDGPRQSW